MVELIASSLIYSKVFSLLQLIKSLRSRKSPRSSTRFKMKVYKFLLSSDGVFNLEIMAGFSRIIAILRRKLEAALSRIIQGELKVLLTSESRLHETILFTWQRPDITQFSLKAQLIHVKSTANWITQSLQNLRFSMVAQRNSMKQQ